MSLRLEAILVSAVLVVAFLQVMLPVAVASKKQTDETVEAGECPPVEAGECPPIDPENAAKAMQEMVTSVNTTLFECSMTNLTMEELAGEWHLSHYKEKTQNSVVVQLSYQLSNGHDSLKGTMTVNGQEPFGMWLFQAVKREGAPIILANLLPTKEKLPLMVLVYMLSAKPDQYFTVLQAGIGTPETLDWAIYTRPGVELTKKQVKKASLALKCLFSKIDPDQKGPRLHKVNPGSAGGDKSQPPEAKN